MTLTNHSNSATGNEDNTETRTIICELRERIKVLTQALNDVYLHPSTTDAISNFIRRVLLEDDDVSYRLTSEDDGDNDDDDNDDDNESNVNFLGSPLDDLGSLDDGGNDNVNGHRDVPVVVRKDVV